VSAAAPRFASVILDVDSTLAGIEGIDVLAMRAGPEAAARIARLTERAMSGELALEHVYGERLAAIRPSRDAVAELAKAYEAAVAPGAARVIAALRAQGVSLALVSGGLREAILPLARELGFAREAVRAVSVRFAPDGSYAGYDARSPLATQQGKAEEARALGLPRPVLAVGDGATDLARRPVVDAFAAFVGFARRETVVAEADYVVTTFDELLTLVLS
jgi:phosphoserine phosphatase